MYKIATLSLSLDNPNIQILEKPFSTLKECVKYAQSRNLNQFIAFKHQTISEEYLTVNIPKYIEFINQFNQFAQQYHIDYCRSIILKGDIKTNPGYQQFRVLFESRTIDVIYIEKKWYDLYKFDKIISDESFGHCVSNHGWLFVCNDPNQQSTKTIINQNNEQVDNTQSKRLIDKFRRQQKATTNDNVENKITDENPKEEVPEKIKKVEEILWKLHKPKPSVVEESKKHSRKKNQRISKILSQIKKKH